LDRGLDHALLAGVEVVEARRDVARQLARAFSSE